MRVLVMVKATAESETGAPPSRRMLDEMNQYNDELVKAGIMIMAEGLKASSKGARVHFSGAQRTVTKGPFTDSRDLVAGFWIWEVSSMDEAIEWVKKCPNPMPGPSAIEIRPFETLADFSELAP